MTIAIADHGRLGIRREITVMTVLVVLILATLVAAMTTGSYATPLAQLWGIFTDLVSGRGVARENSQALYVLTVIRIPRLLLALMVGGCLAVSGAAYQGLLRNPMVSPDILGVASGTSTGARRPVRTSSTQSGRPKA